MEILNLPLKRTNDYTNTLYINCLDDIQQIINQTKRVKNICMYCTHTHNSQEQWALSTDKCWDHDVYIYMTFKVVQCSF